MVQAVQVPGFAQVQVDTGAVNALENLGITQDGITMRHETFDLDVFGDEHGGTDGPPIDIQHLGKVVRLRMEFTKWDEAVWKKIEQRLKTETFGTVTTAKIGSLMFAATEVFRLTINCRTAAYDFDFGRVVFTEAHELNIGTKHSILVVEALCHRDATGKIFDQVLV